MKIDGMTNLEKSKAAAQLLHPDWEVVDHGAAGVWVFEHPGRRRLFVMTGKNNFYETAAVGAPGLYQWAWPVINHAKKSGISISAAGVFDAPLADFIPGKLDEILEAVDDSTK